MSGILSEPEGRQGERGATRPDPAEGRGRVCPRSGRCDPLAADRLARLPGPTPFLVLDLDRVAGAYQGGLAARAGRRWVHLDVGAFNGFMEALESGNLLRFPAIDSRGSPRRTPANLTGPTCDSQDTIMFDVPLSVDLAVDDRVFLGTAGAYTTSYASDFNGFAVPGTHVAGELDAARAP